MSPDSSVNWRDCTQLRVLDALPEDQSLAPSIGILTSFSGSVGTCTHAYSCIPSYRHKHINKNKSKNKDWTQLQVKVRTRQRRTTTPPAFTAISLWQILHFWHTYPLLVNSWMWMFPSPQRLMWSSTWSPAGSNALEGCGTFRTKAWLTEAGC